MYYRLETNMALESSKLKFHPVTPSRWADLETLFGDNGACGGCWCMFWRIPRKEYEKHKGDGNKEALRQIVDGKRKPGILAYAAQEPVGWCAVAPRSDYVALERSRILKPVDDEPVWSISCLFVRKDFRRMRVSSQLIRAASDLAKKQGAKIVEGYPTDPASEKSPDPFLWHGVTSAFLEAGFTEVARRSISRPIMRLVL